ncbi:hypothetical protein EDD86DRAFT_204529 [Gorgonomyces haynaldii]|nr:hypothetical protein EDD86DRAFT_204529 [Gorgonomyces haynaldii]
MDTIVGWRVSIVTWFLLAMVMCDLGSVTVTSLMLLEVTTVGTDEGISVGRKIVTKVGDGSTTVTEGTSVCSTVGNGWTIVIGSKVPGFSVGKIICVGKVICVGNETLPADVFCLFL